MNASIFSKSKGFINKEEREKERKQFIGNNNRLEVLDNKKMKFDFDNFQDAVNSNKKENQLIYNNSDLQLNNINMSLRM